MSLTEKLKYMAYRAPFATELMSPKYPYKVNPGELCALVNFINSTAGTGAAVVEIGVAQGDTSIFLLEHLRTMADPRPLLLFDTFAGFTDESIAVEVNERGKEMKEYDKFRYGDEAIFQRKLKSQGYSNFKTFKGDASKVDWASIGPIGVVLLDIDLYAPTIKIMEDIYPHLVSGGAIVVDDCLADTPWDGSLQAYNEFITKHGLPFERAGQKGAVVRKP